MKRHLNHDLFPRGVLIPVLCCLLLLLVSCESQTQKPASHDHSSKTGTVAHPPTVTQIDDEGLKELLKPAGKPRLINFWATWCSPCREEFPNLVKIAADHKDKIDVITISWDEPSEINGAVPQFLAEMRSDSPAYLLKSRDQDAAINLVSPDWQGALPFTILINAQGEMVYSSQGKFTTKVLVAAIEKL